jgi:hypothetical protein
MFLASKNCLGLLNFEIDVSILKVDTHVILENCVRQKLFCFDCLKLHQTTSIIDFCRA